MQENRSAVTVYGNDMRTSNENPHVFGEVWGAFMADASTPKDKIYAIYTDYESDYRGQFTFVLATEEPAVGEKWVLPEGDYAVFSVAGNDPKEIGAMWQTIWENDLHRSYLSDYELYENGQCTIYIGVK